MDKDNFCEVVDELLTETIGEVLNDGVELDFLVEDNIEPARYLAIAAKLSTLPVYLTFACSIAALTAFATILVG